MYMKWTFNENAIPLYPSICTFHLQHLLNDQLKFDYQACDNSYWEKLLLGLYIHFLTSS
jgi:hypothetical protein